MKPQKSSGRTERQHARVRVQLRGALRSLAQAEQRAAEAEYLASLTYGLDPVDDVRMLAEPAVSRLRQLTHADQISLSFGTALQGVEVVLLHGQGPPQFEALRHQRLQRAAGGVFWSCIESGQALFVDDYLRSPVTSAFMRQAGLSAVAHLPFGQLDGEVGVLSAFRFGRPRPWTPRERALLATTAHRLGQAVQRAQHIRELDRAARYASAISQVARLTETPLSLYETVQKAAELMAGPAHLDLAVLAEVHGERVVHRLQFQSGELSAALLSLIERGLPRAQSLAWRSLEQGQALFIDHYQDSPLRIEAFVTQNIQAIAFVPINAGDPEHGLVLITGRIGGRPLWTEQDKELLLTAANSVRLSYERQHALASLHAAAMSDPLTQLGNRRALEDALTLGLAKAQQLQAGLSVISLDLDGLKVINDRDGHERGDALLVSFARSLQRCFRSEDVVFRVGGDEFVVVVQHREPSARVATELLARVRAAVEQLQDSGFVQVDASAGIATFPDDAGTAEGLLRLSDQRMYFMKQQHQAARRQ